MIKHLQVWEKALPDHFTPEKAAAITDHLRQHYDAAMAELPKTDNRQLRSHLINSILPVLALYRALQEVGLDQEEALATTQDLFFLTLERSRKEQHSLGKLPVAYSVYRMLIRPVMKIVFPEEDFNAEWVETSKERLAFNMHGCFYLNALTHYGNAELTQVFCNADDYLYENASPHISWERTQTLAKGGKYCDFRWVRKRS